MWQKRKKGLHLRRDRGRRSFCSLKRTRVHANRRPPDAITDFLSTPNLNVFFSQPQLPPNLLWTFPYFSQHCMIKCLSHLLPNNIDLAHTKDSQRFLPGYVRILRLLPFLKMKFSDRTSELGLILLTRLKKGKLWKERAKIFIHNDEIKAAREHFPYWTRTLWKQWLDQES